MISKTEDQGAPPAAIESIPISFFRCEAAAACLGIQVGGVRQAADHGRARLQVAEGFLGRAIALRLVLGDQSLNNVGQVLGHALQHATDVWHVHVGRGMPHHPGQLLVAAEGGQRGQTRDSKCAPTINS